MPAARVAALYTASAAGLPMTQHESVRVVAGSGIAGDRYADGRGHWSFEARYVSEVTFVEAEVVARIAAGLDRPFSAADTRRNVVTTGIRLLDLIGQHFRIGEALFTGERPCDPCGYLDRLLDLPARALLGRDGGLRAGVVGSGLLRVGDTLTVAVDNAAARS